MLDKWSQVLRHLRCEMLPGRIVGVGRSTEIPRLRIVATTRRNYFSFAMAVAALGLPSFGASCAQTPFPSVSRTHSATCSARSCTVRSPQVRECGRGQRDPSPTAMAPDRSRCHRPAKGKTCPGRAARNRASACRPSAATRRGGGTNAAWGQLLGPRPYSNIFLKSKAGRAAGVHPAHSTGRPGPARLSAVGTPIGLHDCGHRLL